LFLLDNFIHFFAHATREVVEKKKKKSAEGKEPKLPRGSMYKPVNKVSLVGADLLMIMIGMVLPTTSGWQSVVLQCSAACFFCFVIFHSVRALIDIVTGTSMDYADAGRVASIAVLKVVAWTGYPAIYFLTDAGYITVGGCTS
jgi:bacteriorhodopsin